MSRLSVRLPETLHQELTHEAKDEGVSLNQYVVYLLARRNEDRYPLTSVPDFEVAQQLDRFESLMSRLGPPVDTEEALTVLRELREPAEVSENEAEIVAKARSLRQGRRRKQLQP